MTPQSCCKCGKDLPPGSTKYILSIKLYADFDGNIESPDNQQDVDDIEHLISCLEELGAEGAENDVHLEMAFLLCRDCRNNFSKNPLNKKSEDLSDKNGCRGFLH